jgi:hypothetical protein
LLFYYGTRTGQGFKTFFGCSANRAAPIVGRIAKLSSFGDLAFSIPSLGVIDTSTIDGLALIQLFWVGHPGLLGILAKNLPGGLR